MAFTVTRNQKLTSLCFNWVCVCESGGLTAIGVLGAVRLRRDRRCWLRSENLRMDSLLREARERRELVLLNPPAKSSPPPPLSAEPERKLSAPLKERRTFPIHPDTWEWATDSLSPRYSITARGVRAEPVSWTVPLAAAAAVSHQSPRRAEEMAVRRTVSSTLTDACCRVDTAAAGKVTEQQEGSSGGWGCSRDRASRSVTVAGLRHSPVWLLRGLFTV